MLKHDVFGKNTSVLHPPIKGWLLNPVLILAFNWVYERSTG